jgi:hypothetical protein
MLKNIRSTDDLGGRWRRFRSLASFDLGTKAVVEIFIADMIKFMP